MRIRARRRWVRLLRSGNDRKVATIFSETYPTVLSQFTITNTITKTIITSISSRGSTDELAAPTTQRTRLPMTPTQKTERQAKAAWEEWTLSRFARVGTTESGNYSKSVSVGTIDKWKL